MKYIDADRLRAEIEVIQNSLEHRDVKFDQVKQLRTDCMVEFCKMLNNVIDSLQQEQPAADLSQEIEKYYYDNFAFISSAHNPTKDIVSDIASHFYELGQRKAAEMYDEIEYNRQRATSAITFEYRIIGRNAIENLDMIELENAGISWGDEVIVQIMKKEGSK